MIVILFNDTHLCKMMLCEVYANVCVDDVFLCPSAWHIDIIFYSEVASVTNYGNRYSEKKSFHYAYVHWYGHSMQSIPHL